MGGSGDTEAYAPPPQKLGGQAVANLATTEQGRPLPVIYGTHRVGITYISNPFNVERTPQYKEIGKKDDPIVTGYVNKCSFAALVCHGPISSLNAIYFDDEKVWPPTANFLTPGAEAYTEIETGRGIFRFYWGTESQAIDTDLAKLSAAYTGNDRNPDNAVEEHPGYVGQCYIVALNFTLGLNETRTPNIEFVISRWPSFAWISTEIAGMDSLPPPIIAEAATNTRYGLGLTDSDADSIFDRASFDAFVDQMNIEGAGQGSGISPVVTTQTTFWEFCIEMMEYFDGYLYTTDAGKIALGLIRKPSVDDDTLPKIDEADLIERPEIESDSIMDGRNDVRVVFSSMEADYKQDCTSSFSVVALEALGAPVQTMLQRLWATNGSAASKIAIAMARRATRNKVLLNLKIRKSSLQGMLPGSLFHFNYTPLGLCWTHCRIKRINIPEPYAPMVEIEAVEDHGELNGIAHTVSQNVTPSRPNFSPAAITQQRLFETPCYKQTPRDFDTPLLTVLASRPNNQTTQANILFETEADVFTSVGVVNQFAVHAVLDIEYLIGDTGDMYVTVDSPFDDMPASINEPTGDDVDYLLIIGDEVMRCWNPVLQSGTSFRISVDRGALDSKEADHDADDEVWIVKYSAMFWQSFRTGRTADIGDTLTVKAQAMVGGNAVALADCTEITTTFQQRFPRPWKPRNLAGPTTFNGSASITVTWDATNRDGGAFVPGSGPHWELDIRRPSDNWDYDDPTNSQYWFERLAASRESFVITMADLADALGSVQTIVVRIWAWQAGFYSLNYEEITITKV